MADMNQREIVHRFEEIANYDLPAETTTQHLQDVRRRLLRQTAVRPRRRCVRWAGLAAAVVIVVASPVLWRLFPSPRLQAAELLTQVTQAMEKLAWVKVVTEVYKPDQNEPISVSVFWTDLANRRVYITADRGYVTLLDYQIMERIGYRPDANEIVIEPLRVSGEWSSTSTVQGYIAKLKREGVSVHQSETTFRSRKAILLEFDETLSDVGTDPVTTTMVMDGKFVKTVRSKLIIDPNHLIGSGEVSHFERSGRLISVQKSRLESPSRGPSDIYDLGVPKGARIVNRMPSPASPALRPND
jgi:hypothetical protein